MELELAQHGDDLEALFERGEFMPRMLDGHLIRNRYYQSCAEAIREQEMSLKIKIPPTPEPLPKPHSLAGKLSRELVLFCSSDFFNVFCCC